MGPARSAHRCPQRGRASSCSFNPFERGGDGDGREAGTPPACPTRGPRVAVGGESGSEAGELHPRRGDRNPSRREALRARFEVPAPSRRAFGQPAALRGVSKLPGAWGALRGSRGTPAGSGLGGTARGEAAGDVRHGCCAEGGSSLLLCTAATTPLSQFLPGGERVV